MSLKFALTLVLHQCSLFHAIIIILQLKIFYGFAEVQPVKQNRSFFQNYLIFGAVSSDAAVPSKKVWCCGPCKNLSRYSEMGCVVGWVFLRRVNSPVYKLYIHPYSQVQSLCFDCVSVRTGAGVGLRRADINGVFLKHSVAQIGVSHCEKRQ